MADFLIRVKPGYDTMIQTDPGTGNPTFSFYKSMFSKKTKTNIIINNILTVEPVGGYVVRRYFSSEETEALV